MQPRQGAPIRRIALTHAHLDHIGSLDKLRELLGADIPNLLSKADARILAGQVQRPARGSWPKKLTTKPDVRLTGGDRVSSLEARSVRLGPQSVRARTLTARGRPRTSHHPAIGSDDRRTRHSRPV